MRDLTKYEYLIKSQELDTFVKSKVEIERFFEAIKKDNPRPLLEKYKKYLPFEESKELN
jgi:hypothetical protein